MASLPPVLKGERIKTNVFVRAQAKVPKQKDSSKYNDVNRIGVPEVSWLELEPGQRLWLKRT